MSTSTYKRRVWPQGLLLPNPAPLHTMALGEKYPREAVCKWPRGARTWSLPSELPPPASWTRGSRGLGIAGALHPGGLGCETAMLLVSLNARVSTILHPPSPRRERPVLGDTANIVLTLSMNGFLFPRAVCSAGRTAPERLHATQPLDFLYKVFIAKLAATHDQLLWGRILQKATAAVLRG